MNSISNNYKYRLSKDLEEKIVNFISYSPKIIKHKFDYTEQYYRQVINYVKTTIQKEKFQDQYSISDCGRLMPSRGEKSMSIQTLSGQLKSALFKDIAYDIDMVNASFNICKYIINRFLYAHKPKFKTLIDYANNRSDYLNEEFDKKKYIHILFCKDPAQHKKVYNPVKINKLIDEIKEFRNMVIDNKEIFNIKQWKENAGDNRIGSDISYIIFSIENQILQPVLSNFKEIIIAPTNDGIMIKRDGVNLDEVLEKCNELSSKYGVKFINKDFQKSPIDLSLPVYSVHDQLDNKYDEMKVDFEKKHFIIRNPLIYIIQEGARDLVFYNKGDFKDLTGKYYWEDNSGKPKQFFDMWARDAERREYETITWIPSNAEEHKSQLGKNYNSFDGLKSVEMEEKEWDKNAINLFNDHLDLLVNYEPDGLEYLKNYIAHMFQKTIELPEVALIFKSKQGVGKDLMTSILGDIMGKEYLHKDSRMENIIGNFNEDLENKIIIQLNEVCGKDGHFNREALKDMITAEQFNINRKYGKKLKCNNYIRPFLFTNNLNAIHIPNDDRRYVVFKSGDPKSKEYYGKLVNLKNNKKSVDSIYSFFMKRDISKFNTTNRYISEEYLKLQDHNSNPFYEYIYDICENPKEHLLNETNNEHYITVKDLGIGYKKYLEDNDLEHIIPNTKSTKLIFSDCKSVKATKFYIGGKQCRGYKFNLGILKEYIEKHHHIKEDDGEKIEFDTKELDFV